MTKSIKTIIYPVKDLAKAKILYSELLGVKPSMDEAYYVGFKVDGQDVGLVTPPSTPAQWCPSSRRPCASSA